MGTTPKFINQEWLGQNALRAFPLADDATELDSLGAFRLPRDLVVDMILAVPAEMFLDPACAYLSNVGVYAHGITLSFSYSQGGTAVPIGRLSVAAATHTLNRSYFLIGEGEFEGCTGVITVGSLANTLKFGGSFDFTVAGGRLLPTVIRPDIRGVKRVKVRNGSDDSVWLDGDLQLEAGRNVRLTVNLDGPVPIIRIDALTSKDLNSECGCENEVDLGPPIRTISGVAPRPDGSLSLLGGTCVTVTPDPTLPATLVISDSCSKPCCGDPELQKIQDDQNNLALDQRAIAQLLQRVESFLQQMACQVALIDPAGLTGVGGTGGLANPI